MSHYITTRLPEQVPACRLGRRTYRIAPVKAAAAAQFRVGIIWCPAM